MWLYENLGSIIVGIVLITIVSLVIVGKIKNKKSNKNGCGCGCSNCSMNGICHKTEDK